MSKNSQGYMGIQIGKLGPAVGRIYRREQVYSAYQPHVRNPRTEAQQANRARFRRLMGLTRAFVPATALGLSAAAENAGLHYRNLFTKLNADAVSTAMEPEVRYGELVVAQGPAVGVMFSGVAAESGGKVVVAYDANMETPGARVSDEVYVFAYGEGLGYGVMSGGVARTVGRVELELPSVWAGERMHVYGFVRTTNRQAEWDEALGRQRLPFEVSGSVYVGVAVVVE